MTEDDQQKALAGFDSCFYARNGVIINRRTGKAPTTGGSLALASGPTGKTNAIQLSAGTIEDTNVSLSYAGDFVIKISVSGIDATGTYYYIGDAFWVRVYLDGATYKAAVRYNGSDYIASLSWYGAGFVYVVVVRDGAALKIYEGNE
jgi:hypothetical protein